MNAPSQFESFMRSYQNMVFTTALRLLGNESDAEDIAQDVFLKAFEHFEELKHSPTSGGWLKTVTRNLCLNHLTRYRARWRFFSEMPAADDEADVAADLPAPESHDQTVNAADQRRILEQALIGLPTSQRISVVLHHFENLSYEEIARRLRVSLGKVKTDIHRGRAALRRKLQLTAMAELR